MSADDTDIEWQPLSGEAWEAQAFDVLDELAQAVVSAEPSAPGLSGGAAGMALFLAYYAEAREDEAAEARATELLERACAGLGNARVGPDFFAGWTGIAWAVEHLAGVEPHEGDTDKEDPHDEDPNDAVDAALSSMLAKPAWPGPYDLVSGLCGLAVYALERLPRPSAARALEQIAGHLDRLSTPAEAGRTWHTPAEHLPPRQREALPEGYQNLGLAHGVPGIIAILARTVAADIATERARPLLEAATSWLRAQALDHPDARFAPWTGPGLPAEPSRTAWCYGDPGVACALFSAARALDDQALEREAIDLALGAAKRPPEACGVTDGGLCHGAFGLAHLYLRFYNATHNPELRQAASDWLGRGLAMRRPGFGLAGFAADKPGRAPVADPGLLEGIAGIGLALVAALTDSEPAWDRWLLTDLSAV
jgi:lantibiotic biosynthesis protein